MPSIRLLNFVNSDVKDSRIGSETTGAKRLQDDRFGVLNSVPILWTCMQHAIQTILIRSRPGRVALARGMLKWLPSPSLHVACLPSYMLSM